MQALRQGRAKTRGATLIHGECRTLVRIQAYPRQLTYALRRGILGLAFPRALSGPFGNLHFDPALSFPDSLCAHNCFDLRFNGFLYDFLLYYRNLNLSTPYN